MDDTRENWVTEGRSKDIRLATVEHEIFYKQDAMLDIHLTGTVKDAEDNETNVYFATVKKRWTDEVIWGPGEVQGVEHFLNLLCMLDNLGEHPYKPPLSELLNR